MSEKFPTAKLTDIAELNPTLGKKLPAEELVSFVPMASLSAESASVETTQDRPYAEVAKGFTPFLDGDVLVAKITPCFENGKIAQARLPRSHGFGSTEFHVIRARSAIAESRYLHHYLRLEEVRANGQRRMTGSGGQRRVPASFLADLAVPLPPLEEQRRIAAILDQAETLRTQRRTALALLESLTQSLFLDMFGDPVANPKGWPFTRLDQLVRHDDSINYGVVQPGDAFDEGVPLVRVGDVVDGNFDPAALKRIDATIEQGYKRSRLRGDEILVTCVGSIGVVALVEPSMKGFNIARAVSRIPVSEQVNRVFLASYLRTDFVQRYFTSELRTVSQPTLNIKQICETRVIQPPLDLQQTFATRIAAIEALKATHRRALAALDALFASLQQRAFAGQL